MNLYEVLRRPLITEKHTALQEQGKYGFEIAKRANKYLVKQAVEKSFNVNVVSVNMINVPGKTRRVGKRQVETPTWKKAIVTIEAGQKIEFFEGV